MNKSSDFQKHFPLITLSYGHLIIFRAVCSHYHQYLCRMMMIVTKPSLSHVILVIIIINWQMGSRNDEWWELWRMKYMNGNNRHHHHSHHFCFYSSSSPSHHLYLLSFVPPHTVWFLYLAALAPSLTNARNPEITTLQIGKSVNCRREEILVWSHAKSFVWDRKIVPCFRSHIPIVKF